MRWAHLAMAGFTSAIALSACSVTGNDQGALNGQQQPQQGAPPSTSSAPPTASHGAGPTLSTAELQGSQGGLAWVIQYAQVKTGGGAAAINAALLRQAQKEESDWVAQGGTAKHSTMACQSDALRSDNLVVSFRNLCTSAGASFEVTSATFAPSTGKQLTLEDLFTGSFLETLSTSAVTQLVAGGATQADANRVAAATDSAFSVWALDPDDLEVTFDLSTGPVNITFPLSSLSSFIKTPGPLA